MLPSNLNQRWISIFNQFLTCINMSSSWYVTIHNLQTILRWLLRVCHHVYSRVLNMFGDGLNSLHVGSLFHCLVFIFMLPSQLLFLLSLVSFLCESSRLCSPSFLNLRTLIYFLCSHQRIYASKHNLLISRKCNHPESSHFWSKSFLIPLSFPHLCRSVSFFRQSSPHHHCQQIWKLYAWWRW